MSLEQRQLVFLAEILGAKDRDIWACLFIGSWSESESGHVPVTSRLGRLRNEDLYSEF